MKITKIFRQFFASESGGGILLIICTVISILLANFFLHESYVDFWHEKLGLLSIEGWINDGLMAIFFFMIGLELKREVFIGELSSARTGLLPVFAALGGMLVPAGIYMLLNFGTDTQHGFGIPMATDIAFAIGILSLLGDKVPFSLKVFLTAVAVIDDLGAIVIIALFYSSNLAIIPLTVVFGIFILLMVLNLLKVKWIPLYLVGGVLMWYFMLQSGVHATVAGILLALTIPFEKGSKQAASYKLQTLLHVPVAYIILPIFALANTAIVFGEGWNTGLLANSSLGIILGLVFGKPIGILLICFLVIKLKIAELPGRLNWNQMLGAGMLAGIGFTMSIFIALLAFDSDFLITESKISILFGSLISGIIGFLWLKWVLNKEEKTRTKNLVQS